MTLTEKEVLRKRVEHVQDLIDELDRKIKTDQESISFNQSLMNYLQDEWQSLEKELKA